jgi:translation elongation factor EF-Tu-like GTPase
MALLFVVEDVFEIKERGVLAIGKLADPDARFRIGDPVQVRGQDGSVIRTEITGIPMGMMKVGRAEVLMRGIKKSDILPGDEVWLEDASEPTVAPDRGGIR